MEKMGQYKMFGLAKQIIVSAMMFFSCNVLNVNSMESVSMSNREFKVRSELIIIVKPSFYPCSVKIGKCSGSCNNINDPYAKLCVPDVVRNINLKVFNLMSNETNETYIKYIKLHETCKCKYRLDASVSNGEQRRNEGKGMCECRELIDKGSFDKGFIWNPSNVNVLNHAMVDKI